MTVFVLMWCNEGLESVLNATDLENENLLHALKTGSTKSELGRYIFMMKIRAQANTQRHYEIYSVATDDSITEQDLRRQFHENPQGMADLIRERGQQIHSDRATKSPLIV
jgi:hypothetical protein